MKKEKLYTTCLCWFAGRDGLRQDQLKNLRRQNGENAYSAVRRSMGEKWKVGQGHAQSMLMENKKKLFGFLRHAVK